MSLWGVAIGGIVGGIGSIIGGSEQANAAQNAQQISQNEFNTITGQESPYMQSGYGSLSQLDYLMGVGTPGSRGSQGQNDVGGTPGTASSSPFGGYGSLLTPFSAKNMQQYSPAYKFQMQQGQQGVLNQDAASQGAMSGASLKDLISFNQNYANTAFNNAFNQYQTQQGNTFQKLSGIAQLGQSAAANTGQQGTALAGQASQSATNVGTAIGGGIASAGNSIGNAYSTSSAIPWILANQNQQANNSGGFVGGPG